MKILVLTPRVPYPPRDGGSIVMYNTLRVLHLQGHEVHLLSINTPKHSQGLSVFEGITHTATSVDVDTRLKPLKALGSLLFRKSAYNIERFKSKTFAVAVQQTVQALSPELVLLEGTYLAQYIPAIRQTKVACKVALRTHNVEFEIWKRLAKQTQNPIKKAYFQHLATRGEVFEKWAATQPDAWIAITEKDAQWYRKHSPHKPNIVIPSGANLAEPPVPSDFQPTYQAGFLASLDWQPNLQGLKWFVHQVLPMVVDKCSNFKLKVAGRNPGQEVLQLAGPHVQVLGEVEDAAQFFAENRVMVVPLLAGSGMRVKLLEQFGAGCAVISTPVGAEGLAVTHNQELLIAADAPAFAQSLLHLMQDAALQHRLAISGYQFVKDTYSWQAIGKQFSTFFATL